MDAVVFHKEIARMCRSYVDCKDGCPLRMNGCSSGIEAWGDLAEKRVEIVERWSKEHPPMTNRRKFEEVFGIDDQWIETNFDRYMPTVMIPYSVVTKSWWDAEYKGE